MVKYSITIYVLQTPMRQVNKISVSPEYPRIYHLDKNISKMTHDDISLDSDVVLPT